MIASLAFGGASLTITYYAGRSLTSLTRASICYAYTVTAQERTLTTLGLVVVGFFWTSGGFYGSEVAMDGPPLYVLIICLTMPLLYSLPTALISAELATNYPE